MEKGDGVNLLQLPGLGSEVLGGQMANRAFTSLWVPGTCYPLKAFAPAGLGAPVARPWEPFRGLGLWHNDSPFLLCIHFFMLTFLFGLLLWAGGPNHLDICMWGGLVSLRACYLPGAILSAPLLTPVVLTAGLWGQEDSLTEVKTETQRNKLICSDHTSWSA